MMGRLRAVIEDLELIDRELATHTTIDRVLVSKDCDLAFPQYQLSPASTNVSDHCPIALKPMESNHFYGFRFESHWLHDDQFKEVVYKAWSKQVLSQNPIRVLHTKMTRTAKALKSWNKDKVRWTVFASNIASEIIFNLDLKAKLLGFAAIEKQMASAFSSHLDKRGQRKYQAFSSSCKW
ncbi:hypothetical protein ACQ4PT_017214 [Festuca glaucescens]